MKPAPPIELRDLAELLRAYCPTRYPVSVRIVPTLCDRTRCVAQCLYRPRLKRFDVDLAGDAPHAGMLVDGLVHEWAHAMAWFSESPDHDESWGVAYSRAYRVAIEGWRPKSNA